MIDIQHNRENDDPVYTYIELEKNVVKNTELSTSELVASEVDQIEHPESLQIIESQKNRENCDFVDTDIDLELNNVVEILLT